MKNIELSRPEEPTEIKTAIQQRVQQDRDRYDGDIDWESAESWWGNEIQSYLWRKWKSQLKPHGFTWQKFLKLMSFSTEKIVLWVRGEATWDEVIADIEENIRDLGSLIVTQ